jgi:hypothetical protein
MEERVWGNRFNVKEREEGGKNDTNVKEERKKENASSNGYNRKKF